MNRAERRAHGVASAARRKAALANARARGGFGDGLVQVGYLHGDWGDRVSHSFMESFGRLVAYDAGTRALLTRTDGPLAILCDSGSIAESRNLLARMFLDTPHEWLLMIDSDMGFQPDSVERLLDAADPVEAPIMGALAFSARVIAGDGFGGRRIVAVPTLFRLAQDPGGNPGFANVFEYPVDSIVEVSGTGGAFLLIHRGVMEKLRAEHGDHWFSQVNMGGDRIISEDLSFCARAGKAGYKVHVHTGVKTTHHKSVWLGEQDYHLNAPGAAYAVPTSGVSRETGGEVSDDGRGTDGGDAVQESAGSGIGPDEADQGNGQG